MMGLGLLESPVSHLFFLSMTLVSSVVCESCIIIIKQVKFRNGNSFDNFGQGNICSCAAVFNHVCASLDGATTEC